MNMRGVFFIIMSLCLFCSCNEEVEHKRLLMKDGTIVCVENESVTNYESEQDLTAIYNGYSFSRSMQQNVTEDVVIRRDSVYGYSSIGYLDRWSIATFGDWIADYGLDPRKEYYVQTIVEVKKQLPCYSGEQLNTGIYTGEISKFMGYISNVDRGFSISSNRDNAGYFIGTTIMTYIGYDKEGNAVGIYYPVNDLTTLKWRFSAILVGWGGE